MSGKFFPEWPQHLLGCVTGLDSLGTLCAVVDGEDPRADERAGLRSALKEYLNLPHGPVPESAVSVLYEETDWILPPV